ncbi:DUF551 domain-containing protein [Escherichia coli]|nr:DUF551 domain-containing protein [Escherichia coli]ELT6616693.1 DUF551 domain-containing protein [Escherichia coli]ELX1741183.1 DUF551 domain-containing protein [Escherichia coli]
MTTITREQAQKIIEAADEVISALAGTNEDVHPGSDNMLRLWDDLNDRHAPPEVVRELARIVLASLEAEPVSQTYNLPELIEGMEVSIDVSTCDADLGNRYFGTVTEALELDTAKNGYILLVQDAEPNFDVNGNSPVTPGGWISCSERMPEDTKMLLAFSQGQIVAAYWNWVMSPIDYKKYRAFTYLSGNILDDVTHWMPLPEPPQEAK